MTDLLKDRTAIVGIGLTPFAKKRDRSELDAGCEAIKLALDDAGLSPRDVDGMVRYEIESNTQEKYARALGIENLRFYGSVEYGGGAGCGTILHAATAVATGVADVVVCLRSRNRGSGGRPWAKTANWVEGDWQFSSPYGLVRPVDQIGIVARRMMIEAGVRREHFGAAAIAVRRHAERNPMALMRKPLSMDEYLAARMIADPMCLFDCCLESDGSLACVITSAERARDLRQRPAYIHAAAQGMGPNASIMTNYYKRDFLSTANTYVARDLWRRSDIQPADLRCAQLYDAFTPLILVSLEEFGLVKAGEAGDFALAGNLEWPHGRLPTNTSGGSLSEAYVHGFNLICEGVRQIRGTAVCQVPDCESVLVTSGAGVPNGALLLRQ
ncbi:MAG TPA: lipid-transfer protein [Candidatus Dormibacteraeota bacterium]|nr:lipid-transfer protein [Candidatus Dormibacteraeota bacterium]